MKKLIALFTLTFIMLSSASYAEEFSKAQKAEIQKMFKEYILNNGETIIESVESYQVKKEEESRKQSDKKAASFMKEIEDNKNLPMTGNADGDITLLEFFDYNCGYCRRALEEINKVLEKDDQLKVIFLDMPILGASSMDVSKWSLAAHEQGKYFEYHQALLNHNGQKTNKVIEDLAKKVGLDFEQLKKDKNSKEIADTLNKNVTQAQEMGIRGTPGFIIDGKVYPGYMPAARIEQIIKDARAE